MGTRHLEDNELSEPCLLQALGAVDSPAADLKEHISILREAAADGWTVSVGTCMLELAQQGASIAATSLELRCFPSSDMEVFRQVYLQESYLPLASVAQDIIAADPGSIIIDGGANVGLTSIWLQKKLRASKVLANEAQIITRQRPPSTSVGCSEDSCSSMR